MRRARTGLSRTPSSWQERVRRFAINADPARSRWRAFHPIDLLVILFCAAVSIGLPVAIAGGALRFERWWEWAAYGLAWFCVTGFGLAMIAGVRARLARRSGAQSAERRFWEGRLAWTGVRLLLVLYWGASIAGMILLFVLLGRLAG